MMFYVKFVIVAVVGYLLGSISPAYFIGKLTNGTDIRKKGSGNLGSTNVLRVLGAKAAAITFVADVLKGFVTMLICDLLFSDTHSGYGAVAILIGGLAVILGHNFPFYLNFKGGKGIATSFGIALYLNPFGALFLLLIEWVITLTTGYVSLASVINCLAYPFLVNLVHVEPNATNMYTWILSGVMAIIAIIRHWANIKRLLHGKENRFMLTKTIKEKKPVFKDKQ